MATKQSEEQIHLRVENDGAVIEIDRSAITQVVIRINMEPEELKNWENTLGLSKVGQVRIPELGEFTVTQVRLQSKALIVALAPTRDVD